MKQHPELIIPPEVYELKGLKPNAKLLYGMLNAIKNEQGIINETVESLVRLGGAGFTSNTTIRANLLELQIANLIEIPPQPNPYIPFKWIRVLPLKKEGE